MEMAKMENTEIKNSKLIPRLRFPGFEGEWEYVNGNELFEPISNKNHNSDLPILALTQEQGAVPRDEINYKVIVSDRSVAGYKVVEVDDFIISLRSFQGGIEYSRYKGLCSPAYIVLRKKLKGISSDFYRIYFKSFNYIQALNKNLEGIRDGKMISYSQFSEIKLPKPSFSEQQKIASCLSELDNLIVAQGQKVDALKEKKKGLMQRLFPQPSETTPRLRFPGFEGEWVEKKIGEVADVLQGFGFPDKYQGQKVGELPFCKVGDISVAVDRGERTIYRAANYVDYSLLPILHAKPIPVGATIFAKIGEAIRSNKRIKTGVPCLIDNNTAAVKAKNGEIDDFMFYLMSKVKLADYSGGIVPSVNKSTIEIIPILFPPSPNEQQKIASCLSSLDDLIAAESAKVEALKDHKKGLMQQLFPQPTK